MTELDRQVVAWEMTSSFIWAGALFALAVLLALFARWCFREADKAKDRDEGVACGGVGVVSVVVCLAFTAIGLSLAGYGVKANIAPDVVLAEKAKAEGKK